MEVISAVFKGDFETVAIESGEFIGNFNYPRCKDLAMWENEKLEHDEQIVKELEDELEDDEEDLIAQQVEQAKIQVEKDKKKIADAKASRELLKKQQEEDAIAEL